MRSIEVTNAFHDAYQWKKGSTTRPHLISDERFSELAELCGSTDLKPGAALRESDGKVPRFADIRPVCPNVVSPYVIDRNALMLDVTIAFVETAVTTPLMVLATLDLYRAATCFASLSSRAPLDRAEVYNEPSILKRFSTIENLRFQ